MTWGHIPYTCKIYEARAHMNTNLHFIYLWHEHNFLLIFECIWCFFFPCFFSSRRSEWKTYCASISWVCIVRMQRPNYIIGQLNLLDWMSYDLSRLYTETERIRIRKRSSSMNTNCVSDGYVSCAILLWHLSARIYRDAICDNNLSPLNL